jgi:hypothetical protein
VYGIAGMVVVLLLLVSARYGFHRDELYFVAAGRRLAWGFVDQPPLTPAIARLADLAPGGVTPTILRIAPAISAGVVVVLAAVLARRFGGARRAMIASAAFTAIGGFFLGVGHLLSTTTFDVLAWVVIVALVAAIIDGADPRLWLAVGATVGVGMLNKFTVVALVVGLLVGLLVTPQRRILRSPWVVAGGAVALLIASPTLVWQAANGWPQLEMTGAISGRDGPADYLLIQIAIVSLFLLVPAAIGWWWLATDPDGRRWRAIPIAFGLLFVVFLVTGGKGYYVAPLYVPLLAAGALWFARLGRSATWAWSGAFVVGAAIGLVLALPIVPPENVGPFNEVNGELGETYGWDQLVEQVASVVDDLPPDDRASVVLFTSNYGQASAIEVIAGSRLPQPVSGHNTYWLWEGSGVETMGPIIGVGYVDAALRRICRDVERVGTVTNTAGLENDEYGTALWLCTEPFASLASIWDDVRHYD